MRLTTKGRYAVTAVLDLALHQDSGPVSLAAISERQKISLSYLEQLFAKLRRNDIVSSTRGPGGGYTLTNNVDEVSVSDIILAVDESCKVVDCSDSDGCHGNDYQCLTHDLWQELSNEIRTFLDGISLAEIMPKETVPRETVQVTKVPQQVSKDVHQDVSQNVQQDKVVNA